MLVLDWIKCNYKFDDERLVSFGKKVIYQESPETLPSEMLKKIKREIAQRILSEKKEKWWTCREFYNGDDFLYYVGMELSYEW